jgi:serine/threonine protein kinase/formylglycine-generating enzyme required for sulfatase activity
MPVDGPGAEHEVERRVQEYIELLERGVTADVETYCAGAPAEVRGALRARLVDVLVLKRVMPSARGSAHPPRPGEVLGDFELVSVLGSGAMGVVHLARQRSLDRLVALKVLAPALAGSPRDVERFRREARSAAKLHHPGIVPIFTVGEAHGVAFIAMEFVDGASLHAELERLRARRRSHAPAGQADRLGTRAGLSYPAQVAEIVAQVGEALEHAHSQGVIHRDVKPHNILLDRAGRPHLVDFGLAKDLREPSLSRAGDIAGTPFYMSPEQALAKRVAIDHRTDVFSLGVVLYEMLTLARPFEGQTSHQVLYRITFEEPRPIRRIESSVPRDLEVICAKAMEKRPTDRYATAGDMAADLRRFLAHESIVAQPPSFARKARRALARHRVLSASAAVAVVAVAIGGLVTREVQARLARARDLGYMRATDLDAVIARGVPQELRDALRTADAVLDSAADPRDRAAAADMRERLLAFARAERERGLGLLTAAGEGDPLDAAARFNPSSVDRYWRAIQGLEHLRRAAALTELECDPELASLAQVEALLPRLSLESDVPGASASLRRIEPLSDELGAPVALGALPIASLAVPPGFYRIVVATADGRRAEIARFLDQPRHEYRIAARPRAERDSTGGMVRIEAGEFWFGDDGGHEAWRARRARIAEPFWIDAREVSNAEYKAFLDATGRAMPPHWEGRYDVAWDRLPVVGVSWPDALAYAEWRGKRLPTALEWERAARSTDGRRVPWTVPGPEGWRETPLPSAEEMAARGGWIGARAQSFADYLASAMPVDSLADSRTPDGLFHVVGNVREWTESIAVRRIGAELVPQTNLPIVMGGDFGKRMLDERPPLRSETHFDNHHLTVGFRCARTADP